MILDIWQKLTVVQLQEFADEIRATPTDDVTAHRKLLVLKYYVDQQAAKETDKKNPCPWTRLQEDLNK